LAGEKKETRKHFKPASGGAIMKRSLKAILDKITGGLNVDKSSTKGDTVKIKSGSLEGGRQNGIHVFKGIPYAAPPVGELRWLPPRPVEPWTGVRPALEYGAAAPQNLMPVAPPGADQDVGRQDESCLFLNIWTPGLDDARRPVMVWIHGGAFILGSGNEPSSHGANLAARGDVVVVSINYRLGALGFMNLKEVTGGAIPATGDEGLLDQVAALEWVRDNIAAFGGDPGNVTVFGFSAGGMSIGVLMAMPAARGLFHKAINQSGAANTVGPQDEAVRMTREYLEVLGLTGRDTEKLRALSWQKLLAAQMRLGMRLRETEHIITPFRPVVDWEIVPDFPIRAIRKGSAKGVITLAGTVLDEWRGLSVGEPGVMGVSDDEVMVRLGRLLDPERTPGMVEAYREARKKRGAGVSPFDILCAVQTDLMFRIPTLQLVEAQRDNGQPAYNYMFTYTSPLEGGVYGACHGLDRRFIFGTHDDPACGSGAAVDRLSQTIQDAWLAFARRGDPSTNALGKWPPYGWERLTMLLDKKSRMAAAPFEDERRAWDGIDMLFTPPI
jgi:para-nitrobenzyl esterase